MGDPQFETQTASDGYQIHVAHWPARSPIRGRIIVLHGVQSHGGWYHGLGQTLAEAGYDTYFPDRRGSGANRDDRGHAPSVRRLLDDLKEELTALRQTEPRVPIAIAGISWGGKLAVATAAQQPGLVDALALICPGLHPRVDVTRRERFEIALAFFTNRHKVFPIPLSDPALFTDNPEGRTFIATDNLSLHAGTAGLMAASFFLDRIVKRSPSRIHQPALLILAEQDRIINNSQVQGYFDSLSSNDRQVILYPGAHHTLEFEQDPKRYALDLIEWLENRLHANSIAGQRVDP